MGAKNLPLGSVWWKTQIPHFFSSWAWLLYISLFLSTNQAHFHTLFPPRKNPWKKAALWGSKDRDEFYIYSDNPISSVEVECLESFQVEKTFKSCNHVEGEHLEFLNAALSFSYYKWSNVNPNNIGIDISLFISSNMFMEDIMKWNHLSFI